MYLWSLPVLVHLGELEMDSSKITNWGTEFFKPLHHVTYVMMFGHSQFEVVINILSVGTCPYQEPVSLYLITGDMTHWSIKNSLTTAYKFLIFTQEVLIIFPLWGYWHGDIG